MEELYYIRNVGCDDETCGLSIIPKEFFNTFKEIIENLVDCRKYGCNFLRMLFAKLQITTNLIIFYISARKSMFLKSQFMIMKLIIM